MEKSEHGRRLKGAMSARGYDREFIAQHVEVSVRTVTNWTSGKTMPSDREKAVLREVLGPYDSAGDPVEVAIRSSDLTEDRQATVIGFYLRQLREQREYEAARGREVS